MSFPLPYSNVIHQEVMDLQNEKNDRIRLMNEKTENQRFNRKQYSDKATKSDSKKSTTYDIPNKISNSRVPLSNVFASNSSIFKIEIPHQIEPDLAIQTYTTEEIDKMFPKIDPSFNTIISEVIVNASKEKTEEKSKTKNLDFEDNKDTDKGINLMAMIKKEGKKKSKENPKLSETSKIKTNVLDKEKSKSKDKLLPGKKGEKVILEQAKNKKKEINDSEFEFTKEKTKDASESTNASDRLKYAAVYDDEKKTNESKETEKTKLSNKSTEGDMKNFESKNSKPNKSTEKVSDKISEKTDEDEKAKKSKDIKKGDEESPETDIPENQTLGNSSNILSKAV